jgi:SAM-dependent methyltransferase
MQKKIQNVCNTFRTLYFQSRSLRRSHGRASSVASFLSGNILPAQPLDSVSLDLGCGPAPKNPFGARVVVGVDIACGHNSDIVTADLSFDGIPLGDASVDYCTAYDFIEHVPRLARIGLITTFPFVNLMNEVYRVLKPGGLFLSSTPAYPSKQAFQDPTHVNIITEDTFPLYFCSGSHSQGALFASMYGFVGDFMMIDQAWVHDAWLVTLMEVKK